jgi:hypothetical protein
MRSTQPDPPLPRLPEASGELNRMRREALRNLLSEEGSGPAPVYGSAPPGGRFTRRWTLRRFLVLIAGLLAALAAALFGFRRAAMPVYGGPPTPPQPLNPLPPDHAPSTTPSAGAHGSRRPQPRPSPIRPSAAVYGGPVPRPVLPPTPETQTTPPQTPNQPAVPPKDPQ